jgi:hypothetical protein
MLLFVSEYKQSELHMSSKALEISSLGTLNMGQCTGFFFLNSGLGRTEHCLTGIIIGCFAPVMPSTLQ